MAVAGVTLRANALSQLEGAVRALAEETPAQTGANEDFWLEVRAAFDLDPDIVNLNNGSVCPPPRRVGQAQQRGREWINRRPGLYADRQRREDTEAVRQQLASAFGCHPEELALTRNATEALEVVQFGLDLKPGDEVVTTTHDYPSMIEAWRQRERRDGIVLKVVSFPVPPPSPERLVELLDKAITPRTRVLLFCHVTFTTGLIFPVRKLCRMAREKGVETIVDGAHAFGHFPFCGPELGCDYYGTSLHKWLNAPIGTGFLYMPRSNIPRVWPLFSAPQKVSTDIRKFEHVGTFPAEIRNAIAEALSFQDTLGLERKAARLCLLRRRWAKRLAELPGVLILSGGESAQSCGLGALSVQDLDHGRLAEWLLDKHRIYVRSGGVPNEFSCLRISPNVYTTLGEIDRFCSAVEHAVRHGFR